MSEQTENGINLDGLTALRVPFKDGQINQIPRGNVMLDYVGHAHITARLLEVDPLYNYEPQAFEVDGRPLFDRNDSGQIIGYHIHLTVCGVTRMGYGSVIPGKSDAIKEVIGDAIRNAAMRFGCGLELWMKERVTDNGSSGGATGTSPVPSGIAANLPPSVICDYCGFVYDETGGLKVIPSKYDGKNHKQGDPIFHCTECGKWPPVREAKPVAAPSMPDGTEEPVDDLPF